VIGVAINSAALSRELARRAWSSADLAKAAGLSEATVSAARGGRRVSPTTLRLIANALAQTAPLEEIDALLL
jgi:transcriptional regulator with XRE-family HTH domain